MSELQLFNFQDNRVRVVEIDSNPWFVAADVFKALDIAWTGSQSLDKISDVWKAQYDDVSSQETPGLVQIPNNTWLINEPGVYKIAFRSNKPEAEAFTNYVAEVILPSVRKQGYYVSDTKDVLLSAIAELTKSVTQIKTDYSDQVKYLIESNVVKDEQITQLNNQHNALQEVLNLYPGLDKALQEFQLIEETTESFILKDYLLDHAINLDKGQRIRAGQLVSAWLNLSQQQPLFKLNGNSLYTAKHIPLIKLAIEYIFGWN
jgi:prophage antirepressor-like protein